MRDWELRIGNCELRIRIEAKEQGRFAAQLGLCLRKVYAASVNPWRGIRLKACQAKA